MDSTDEDSMKKICGHLLDSMIDPMGFWVLCPLLIFGLTGVKIMMTGGIVPFGEF